MFQLTRYSLQAAACLLLAAAVGCGTATDLVPDAGHSGTHDGSVPLAQPTEFVFANDGVSPVTLGGNCGITWPSLKKDGKDLSIDGSCACSCAEHDSAQGCPGCPLICLDTSKLVLPGTSVKRSWDGLVMTYDRSECYVPRAPDPEALLSAQVCYDQNGSAMASPTDCASSDFSYGRDQTVTITAKPPHKAAVPDTITIENKTGDLVDVITDHCGTQGFFQLAEDDPNIALNTFCACSCNADFKPDSCPSCGACADDVVKTLAPGESLAITWDGTFSYQYGGCAVQYPMPASYAPRAKVCYTKHGQTTKTCTPPVQLLRSPGGDRFLLEM